MRWAVIVSLTTGCLAPSMRPARTTSGPSVTAAAALLVGAEDEVFCYDECEAKDVISASIPNADFGYGVILADRVGLTSGVALVGPSISKRRGVLGLLAAYSQLSLQSDRLAFALGLDVAGNMIGGGAAIDLDLAGRLGLTLSTRTLFAIDRPDNAKINDVEVDSSELSLAIRWGRLLLQHSLYRRESGRLELPAYVEGATEARTWHVLIVGVRLDIETAPHLNL